MAKEKEKLLKSLNVKDFFLRGKITINRKTCRGIECRLCMEACPTHALFWQLGKVGIARELCIYCGACILSCIVEDCIRITRKRASGEIEIFSRSKQFMALQSNINAEKRIGKIKGVFPTADHYLKNRKKKISKKRQ